MADTKPQTQTYTMPFLWSIQLGETLQVVLISKDEKVRIVYVHASRAKEVEVDQSKKTITVDVEQMGNFKDVEFTKNLQVLRFSQPKYK